MIKQLKIFLPLFFLFLTLTLSPAFAQDKSVVVQRRDGDMTINQDGSVSIVETWVVEFRGGPFRFAFRSIPFNKISSFVFQSVSENGTEYQRAGSETPNTFEVESSSNERTVTWYFPPTTNQTRTFQLRYVLYDPLRIYPDGDQFWWKFIEQDRAYPINAARVTVHLPSTLETNQIGGTTYTNMRDTGGARVLDGQTIEFNGGPFPPNTEWEIRAQFPHGVVSQSVQSWQAADDERVARLEAQARAVEQFGFYSTWLTWLIALGGALALLVLWYVFGRDRAGELPAEFLNAPPADPRTNQILSPALAGTLLDEQANVRDVLATLIDWAQRGILKIRALPQGTKTATPNDDYVYERIGTDAPPLYYQYERALMQRLFQGETSRSIGTIRQKFTASLDEMFNALYDELVRLGYFETRPDRVRARFYRLGWLLLVLLLPAAFLFQLYVGAAIASDLAFSWLALAPWGMLLLVAGAVMYLARYMPRKTATGADAAARWNAFRRYLTHIEKYTNVADASAQFEKYLPYAVAFGIDKTWVQKFAAADTPAPKWYVAPPAARSVSASRASDTRASTSASARAGVDSAPATAPASASGVPSLNQAASGAFTSLNSVSASFFSMLNTTASSFVASNPGSNPSRMSFRSGSGGGSSWSSSSSSHSSFSGGGSSGGGGGGGGRSGFG